jgi:hypothetical protein
MLGSFARKSQVRVGSWARTDGWEIARKIKQELATTLIKGAPSGPFNVSLLMREVQD